jgi:long-subunit fatty acid transport protein
MKRLFLILMLLSGTVFAQYAADAIAIADQTYGFGARSEAMGTAYTGIADDYSAIYWNPAGLAQIRRMTFYSELAHLKYENQATFYDNPVTNDETFSKLSALGFVFPIPTYRGSMVFALGYNRVKDFDQTLLFNGFNPNSNGLSFLIDNGSTEQDYFFDRNVQQEELVKQEGVLSNWSFAGAVDVSPSVSIGATLNFISGNSDYYFEFLQQDNEGLFGNAPSDVDAFDSYSMNQKILAEYSAFQMKFGALIRATRNVRFGLGVTLPHTFNITEQFTSDDRLTFDDGTSFDYIYADGVGSEFEYEVSMPFKFDAGMSVAVQSLTVGAGIEYTDLSQIKFELPSDVSLGSEYDALLDENRVIDENYSDQMKWKVGAEYVFPFAGLSLRGGYLYEPSGMKDTPASYDRKFYSGGIGLTVDEQFILDATMVLGSWEKQSEDSYTPGQVSEKINYQKFYISAGFNF